MPDIIKHARVVADPWIVFRLADGESPASVHLPDAHALWPLPVWQARADELIARSAPLGVWLDAGDDPATLAGQLSRFAVIGVNFPKFADGRGYSTARLLRERYGYQGELRAIGDVLQDQLFLMQRCGFDAFAVRADKDIHAALAGLSDFGERYQAATDEPLPLFRRRATGAVRHD